jgi:UDP-N-acetylglucosamine acyltransferase
MAIDPSASVACTAKVHPDACIGAGARVGEYCVIESDVSIGAECVLEPYVFVKRWTTMGERNEISAGTALGTDPFDKNFTGARSYLRIGNGNRIREHFTVSRGTAPESATEIGDGNYIMSAGHIAHNCKIGDHNVVASCSLLAGYVELEDEAFISGGVAIHQFCKIGRLAMIAGHTGVSSDVPPFITCAGYRGDATGLNLVGLKRAGFDAERIAAVKQAYAILYRSGLLLEEALARIEAEIDDPEARRIAEFIRRSKRGICRERGRR